MTAPFIRNPHLVDVLPIRNLLRGSHPASDLKVLRGGQGLVINDLDAAVKYWGPQHRGDQQGRIRLIEFKHGSTPLSESQHKTFADWDWMLSLYHESYDGFFQVNFDHKNIETIDGLEYPGPNVMFTVTGAETRQMDRPTFVKWMQTPRSPFRGLGQTRYWQNLMEQLRPDHHNAKNGDLAYSRLEQILADGQISIYDLDNAMRNIRWMYT